jgi:excisionase family DNA binding protein
MSAEAAISITRGRTPLDATPPPVRAVNDEQPAADAVLDVDEVARLLRLGRNTIYELVGRNEIPHRRCGKQIRFSRVAIMAWLASWSLQGAKERQ